MYCWAYNIYRCNIYNNTLPKWENRVIQKQHFYILLKLSQYKFEAVSAKQRFIASPRAVTKEITKIKSKKKSLKILKCYSMKCSLSAKEEEKEKQGEQKRHEKYR